MEFAVQNYKFTPLRFFLPFKKLWLEKCLKVFDIGYFKCTKYFIDQHLKWANIQYLFSEDGVPNMGGN